MTVAYFREPTTNLWFAEDEDKYSQLYPSESHGKPVLRCRVCDKVAYNSFVLASDRALQLYPTVLLRPYHNRRCNWFHLTSNNAQDWHAREHVKDMRGITLRDYQEASLDHLYTYFNKNNGNPIVALPTGTGKSVVIGEFVRRACMGWPGTKILMLTHVKELIEQNFTLLLSLWPTAPAGVYSAGLNRKEHRNDITFAGIQSVYRKPQIFGHVDLVLVDECHLVSPRAESMYGVFLDALRMKNSNLKVIGFSATPFRMKQGMLTDADGLFDDVVFDLTDRKSFNWLIQQGWIAPLIPKRTSERLNVTGVKIQGGEFVLRQLQEAVDHDEITHAALAEAAHYAADRNHWLVFASGIAHAEHITESLNHSFGIPARSVHSKMPSEERDKAIADFKEGRIRALVNNNILTTGFDYPEIDCILMLRPTASPGLWVQMLGRGTRPANGKENCLVLDFAGNTERLGPINDPVLPRKKGRGAPGPAPVRLCEHCGCYSHASCRFCENPVCGMEFPRAIKITAQASIKDIIAGVLPDTNDYPVNLVTYHVHKKEGKPDSMCVTYYSGIRRFKEYICLDHGGYATRVARKWWEQRSPWGVPPDVHSGMDAVDYLKVPTAISVMEHSRYPEICGYTFSDGTND